MTYPYLKTKFKSTVPPGAGANLRSRRRARRRRGGAARRLNLNLAALYKEPVFKDEAVYSRAPEAF